MKGATLKRIFFLLPEAFFFFFLLEVAFEALSEVPLIINSSLYMSKTAGWVANGTDYDLYMSKTAGWVANGIDYDQVLHFAASDLSLQCLLRPVIQILRV